MDNKRVISQWERVFRIGHACPPLVVTAQLLYPHAPLREDQLNLVIDIKGLLHPNDDQQKNPALLPAARIIATRLEKKLRWFLLNETSHPSAMEAAITPTFEDSWPDAMRCTSCFSMPADPAAKEEREAKLTGLCEQLDARLLASVRYIENQLRQDDMLQPAPLRVRKSAYPDGGKAMRRLDGEETRGGRC